MVKQFNNWTTPVSLRLADLFHARGIKYFFGNSGADFGPTIDGSGKFGSEKKMHPSGYLRPEAATDSTCDANVSGSIGFSI